MRRISLRIMTFYIHVQLYTNTKLLFPMTFMFSPSKHRVHFQAFIPIENCILYTAFNASFAKFKPIQLRKFSLNFCTKYACVCAFFLHIFHAHFIGFFCILFIAVFIYFLCSFTEMKVKTVCARAQAAFLQSSADHSVTEVAKSLKKAQQRVKDKGGHCGN